MASQFGKFFFFLGLISLVIFWGTFQVREPALSYCFAGLLLFSAGLYLMLRNRSPAPQQSARFVAWRKMHQKDKKKKKEEEEKGKI